MVMTRELSPCAGGRELGREREDKLICILLGGPFGAGAGQMPSYVLVGTLKDAGRKRVSFYHMKIQQKVRERLKDIILTYFDGQVLSVWYV